jgi:hypothetical protein
MRLAGSAEIGSLNDRTFPASSAHRHHWVIAEPSGPSSAGVCKYCQALRVFRNWLVETDAIRDDPEPRGLASNSWTD